MTDRHEAECARVEAEFNGTDEPERLHWADTRVERILAEYGERIAALEAKLDEHGII